jgi:CRISPR-associated endonuclease/helicase Cas3
VTYRSEGAAPQEIPTASTKKMNKDVRVLLEPLASHPKRIARRALDAARAGAKVLVIRNTVRDCVRVQKRLVKLAKRRGEVGLLFTCNGVPAPHHARFSRNDRMKLDEAIETQFGKKAGPGGCVAVATQTVQQSLDLDADFMITDMCPADVLLQRIGRLFRHDRTRVPGYSNPTVLIVTPEVRDLTPRINARGKASGKYGLGTVYEDLRVIEATWRVLERFVSSDERLSIPSMNRELVEQTTHPDALDAFGRGNPLWVKHAHFITGTVMAEKQQATLNLVDRSQPFGEASFATETLSRRIRTRLGEDDRLAEFDEPPGGPFGGAVKSLTIPSQHAGGIPPDAKPAVLRRKGRGFVFRFGTNEFRYGKLGLQRLANRR